MANLRPRVEEGRTRGGRFFVVHDLPDAPECECGELAVFVIRLSQKGRLYGMFSCAKGAGDNWREKCNFSQWLPKEEER